MRRTAEGTILSLAYRLSNGRSLSEEGPLAAARSESGHDLTEHAEDQSRMRRIWANGGLIYGSEGTAHQLSLKNPAITTFSSWPAPIEKRPRSGEELLVPWGVPQHPSEPQRWPRRSCKTGVERTFLTLVRFS